MGTNTTETGKKLFAVESLPEGGLAWWKYFPDGILTVWDDECVDEVFFENIQESFCCRIEISGGSSGHHC